MAVCLLILFYSFGTLTGLFELLRTLERSVTVPESYIRILLKIIGITYVADFSSRICEDAGYKAIAADRSVWQAVCAGSQCTDSDCSSGDGVLAFLSHVF